MAYLGTALSLMGQPGGFGGWHAPIFTSLSNEIGDNGMLVFLKTFCIRWTSLHLFTNTVVSYTLGFQVEDRTLRGHE